MSREGTGIFAAQELG